jgi:hypothetical protein
MRDSKEEEWVSKEGEKSKKIKQVTVAWGPFRFGTQLSTNFLKEEVI